jgi:hypothetical protein
MYKLVAQNWSCAVTANTAGTYTERHLPIFPVLWFCWMTFLFWCVAVLGAFLLLNQVNSSRSQTLFNSWRPNPFERTFLRFKNSLELFTSKPSWPVYFHSRPKIKHPQMVQYQCSVPKSQHSPLIVACVWAAIHEVSQVNSPTAPTCWSSPPRNLACWWARPIGFPLENTSPFPHHTSYVFLFHIRRK